MQSSTVTLADLGGAEGAASSPFQTWGDSHQHMAVRGLHATFYLRRSISLLLKILDPPLTVCAMCVCVCVCVCNWVIWFLL